MREADLVEPEGTADPHREGGDSRAVAGGIAVSAIEIVQEPAQPRLDRRHGRVIRGDGSQEGGRHEAYGFEGQRGPPLHSRSVFMMRGASNSTTGIGGLRRLSVSPRGVVVAIAVATALALVWALARTVDQGQAVASDSRLAGDIQIARTTLDDDAVTAADRTVSIARLRTTQLALSSGNVEALRSVAAAHPGTVLVSRSGSRAG